MAHFNKIAKSLDLRDVGELELGEKECKGCKTPLRVGDEILPKDREKKIFPRRFSYCPKCKTKVKVVLSPRFTQPIKM
ncbi:MAG: hypothetical protein V1756_01205 [Patescibacteria group bacterium]